MSSEIHLASRLLTCAGALMTVSGALMALCGGLAYGGLLWAAASCQFFAAYHFRQKENKEIETEEPDDEQPAL
ncbi:MAG: hypothetical protein ACI3U8_00940 [Candidatus Onthomonas sp.]